MFATRTRLAHLAGAAGLAFSLVAAGCAADSGDEEADQIQTALEQENGGLDFSDEAPMFGEDDIFAEIDPSVPYDDAMEQDATIVADMGAPSAAIYYVAVQWGQIPGDPTVRTPRDWSGTFRVNRGGMIVRRVVRFERATDRILPRDSRDAVSFSSVTGPFNDGLRLVVVDPEPESADALTLSYETADGAVHSASLADLVGDPRTVVVDDLGNRMAAVAFREAADPCAHGFVAGRWHQLRRGLGNFHGIVADQEGEPIGHVRGLYGHRRDGEQLFFGKYIALDGSARGIFGGHWADGAFRGRWIVSTGDVGALGGEYRETAPGDLVGGQFLGRWAETSCNLPLDRPGETR